MDLLISIILFKTDNLDSAEDWLINVTLTIRPSTDTGVMFALVSNETVPLALSIVDSNSSDSQVILQFS